MKEKPGCRRFFACPHATKPNPPLDLACHSRLWQHSSAEPGGSLQRPQVVHYHPQPQLMRCPRWGHPRLHEFHKKNYSKSLFQAVCLNTKDYHVSPQAGARHLRRAPKIITMTAKHTAAISTWANRGAALLKDLNYYLDSETSYHITLWGEI